MNGDQQELIEGAAPTTKKRRKPDYIFEGLCWAMWRKQWRDVHGMDKGRTQRAAQELRLKGLEPSDPKVVAEIERRAQRWRQINERTPKYMGKLDNPVLLAGDWRLCEVKSTIQPGQPSQKEQAAMKHEYKEWSDRTLAWWNALSKRERAERSKRYPRGVPVSQIAWGEYQRERRPALRSDHANG
jgi:hypothetical protein